MTHGLLLALAALVILPGGASAGQPAVQPAMPLSHITTADGMPATVEAVAEGFAVRCSGRFRAEVTAPPDAFLCRLEPAANRDVVQLSIGRVESLRCNALFSPQEDLGMSFEGPRAALYWRQGHWLLSARGPLTVRLIPDFLKTRRGLKWYRPLDKTLFRRAPAGWCSWYVYYQGVTQDEVLKNTDWLVENLKPFGCEYVQIDDGWQGVGHGNGENRDWYVTDQRKFPRGMKWLADAIRARGLKPGLWLIPFSTSSEETFRAHPEVFIHRADGTSIAETRNAGGQVTDIDWTGRFIVDSSGAPGRKWFRDLFTMICTDWGYDYVKIDGQGGSRWLPEQFRDRLADPKLPPDEVYRQGLAAMKSIMGPGRFLLNCGGQYDSCGYCEGIRIGGDVGPGWAGMQAAITATMGELYKNNIAFYDDPDVLCVRPRGMDGSSLTWDQSQVWTTLLGITGQLLMTSDRMYALPPEYVEMVKRVFPVADIRPMDLYGLPGRPRVFDLRVAKPGVGDWDVVALFNWSDAASGQVSFSPRDLGLPPGKYVAYDVWNKRLLGVTNRRLTLSLPPTSCRVLSLRPFTGRPQLLGTSRHLTQGADDLLAARWNPARRTWSGRSAVVGGDPYELRFSLPPGWTCPGARCEGGLAILTLQARTNRNVAWRLRFRQGPTQAARPAVSQAKVQGEGRDALISWSGDNAFAYSVYRDGGLLGQVVGTSLKDRVPRRGVTYHYEVAAVGWKGESERVPAGDFTAQVSPRGTAPDVWLQDLDPTSAVQDWGNLERGTSVERKPMTILHTAFSHGLGTHANSEVHYRLDNRYQRFDAQVGVDFEKGGAGTVCFQVFADGVKLYDSGLMSGNDPAKTVSLPLEGVDELTLIVTDAGDGINCDHADWAEARLIGNQ